MQNAYVASSVTRTKVSPSTGEFNFVLLVCVAGNNCEKELF